MKILNHCIPSTTSNLASVGREVLIRKKSQLLFVNILILGVKTADAGGNIL
jgi:hypothetical protein